MRPSRPVRPLCRAIALLPLAVAAATVTVPRAGAQPPLPAELRGLDAYIARGMREWQIPGMSIAVVRGGRVVLAKGYGVRRLGDPAPVDGRTLFGMMSTTKAMTALGLAMLVDEGRVRWDDPVTKWLPGFEMPDPYVTRDLRVVDLLTHNAGLGNADLLWARGDLSTSEILRRVRGLSPAYPLRGGFVYQNVMYAAAGEVIAAASGMPWARFTTERILRPLGMARSYATLEAVQASGDTNVSSAHIRIRDTLRVIRDQPVDAVPAAGAVWSDAEDAGRWVRFWLDSGRVDGVRLVSDKSFRRLWQPHALVPADEFYPTARFTRPHVTTYGLGWFQQDHRGRILQMHTGSMPGRTAIIGILPEADVGVYILGNADHAEFRHALMFWVLDRMTGAPERDWSAEFRPMYEGFAAARREALAKEERARIVGTTPSQPVAAFAGRYAHPVYGDLELEAAGPDALQLRIGSDAEMRGVLRHWHRDTFRGELGDGRDGPTTITFRTGTDGAVSAVEWGGLTFTRSR